MLSSPRSPSDPAARFRFQNLLENFPRGVGKFFDQIGDFLWTKHTWGPESPTASVRQIGRPCGRRWGHRHRIFRVNEVRKVVMLGDRGCYCLRVGLPIHGTTKSNISYSWYEASADLIRLPNPVGMTCHTPLPAKWVGSANWLTGNTLL